MIHTLLTFVGVHNLRIHFALLGTKRAKDGLLQRLVESLFVWPARFSVWLVLGLELASKSLRVLFGFWRSSRRLRSVSATWALSCLSLFFWGIGWACCCCSCWFFFQIMRSICAFRLGCTVSRSLRCCSISGGNGSARDGVLMATVTVSFFSATSKDIS